MPGGIFDWDVQALVNPVNCVGVAGKGLALEFKKRYPHAHQSYYEACKRGEVRPGQIHVTMLPEQGHYVFHFPTKKHWRDKSSYLDILAGLAGLVILCHYKNIKTISIPALGCGLGGLPWQSVKIAIEQAFDLTPDIRVLLFEPK